MAVYRLILSHADRGMPGSDVDTGATYSGCSKANPNACQPLHFQNQQQAIDYANAHGEVPVVVHTEQAAWDIAEGRAGIQQSDILTNQGGMFSGLFGNMDMTTMLLLGLGAIFVVPVLFKKGRA